MNKTESPFLRSLAFNIRRARLQRHLTIVQVQALLNDIGINVSISLLSRAENALADLGAEVIWGIAKVFNLRAQDLIPCPMPMILFRAADQKRQLALRPPFEISEDLCEPVGGYAYMLENGFYYLMPLAEKRASESIGPALIPRMRAHLLSVTQARAADMEKGIGVMEGEVVIHVLSGTLEIWMRFEEKIERRELEPGDTIQLDLRLPHAFRAIGGDEATALFTHCAISW